VGGLRSPDFYGLALALGGSEIRLDELVRLYAMLAGGGVDRDLILTRGQVPGRSTRLLSPEASFLVLDMLRSNPRPGDEMTPATARRREPVAWKTGTSFGFRDAWAAGIVGRYALGVWVGNFDGTPNPAFVGREAAGPLFFGIVDALRARGERTVPIKPPSGLVRVEVCALSGAPAGPHCPGHTPTWVIAGRSPIATCAIHRDVAIDVATGLRACPDQHTPQQLGDARRSDHANRQPDRQLPCRAPCDQPPDVLRPRAKRHTYPNLTRPLRGGIRGDGVESDRRQQQRHDGEDHEHRAEHPQADAFVRCGQQVVQLHHLEQREIRIDGADLLPKDGGYDRRIGVRSRHDACTRQRVDPVGHVDDSIASASVLCAALADVRRNARDGEPLRPG